MWFTFFLTLQEIVKSTVINHLQGLPSPLGGDKAVECVLKQAYENGAINYADEQQQIVQEHTQDQITNSQISSNHKAVAAFEV